MEQECSDHFYALIEAKGKEVPKICIKCKFHQDLRMTREEFDAAKQIDHFCFAPGLAGIDLVTGEKIVPRVRCADLRKDDPNCRSCGPTGAWFIQSTTAKEESDAPCA